MKEKIMTAVGAVILLLIISLIMVVWVWNAIMPELFGLPTIGLWQAFLLCVLGRFLTGSK